MIEEREKAIRRIVQIAGEAVRTASPTAGLMEKEGRSNFVTAADLASEKIIMDFIRENYPGDQILSEETVSNIQNPLAVDKLWVIDPIDGTNNFKSRQNYSAVSVGYIERGIIKIGAAYDPFRDELFFAKDGKGATLNGIKITTGPLDNLSLATVATDNSTYSSGTQHNLKIFLKLNPAPRIPVKGSAVLAMCEVAAGRIDLYFHNYLKPWDNAAAFLIAKEAGACVKTIYGKSPDFISPSAVIGNESLVEQFLQQIK